MRLRNSMLVLCGLTLIAQVALASRGSSKDSTRSLAGNSGSFDLSSLGEKSTTQEAADCKNKLDGAWNIQKSWIEPAKGKALVSDGQGGFKIQ